MNEEFLVTPSPEQSAKTVRHDAALARRAIRERWPISDEKRAIVVERLATIVEACDDERATVRAASALLEADKLNMEQEKRDLGIVERVDVTSNGAALPAPQLNVAVIDRIAALTNHFAALEGAGNGDLAGHDSGKPVDTRHGESGPDPKAG